MLDMSAKSTTTTTNTKSNLLVLVTLLLHCSDSHQFKISSSNSNNNMYRPRRTTDKKSPSSFSSSSPCFSDKRGYNAIEGMFQKLTMEETNLDCESREKRSNVHRPEYSSTTRKMITTSHACSTISSSHIVDRRSRNTWARALVDLNRRLVGFLMSSQANTSIMERIDHERSSSPASSSVTSTTASNYDGVITASGLSLLLISTLIYSVTFLEGEPLSCFCWSAWTSYICTMVSRVALKEQ